MSVRLPRRAVAYGCRIIFFTLSARNGVRQTWQTFTWLRRCMRLGSRPMHPRQCKWEQFTRLYGCSWASSVNCSQHTGQETLFAMARSNWSRASRSAVSSWCSRNLVLARTWRSLVACSLSKSLVLVSYHESSSACAWIWACKGLFILKNLIKISLKNI